MSEKLRQDTKLVEEPEKVLVPARRREAEKEAEQEIRKEPRSIEQRKPQRRWYAY